MNRRSFFATTCAAIGAALLRPWRADPPRVMAWDVGSGSSWTVVTAWNALGGHTIIIDDYHAHRTRKLYDQLVTARRRS